jgi:hypothetical protein
MDKPKRPQQVYTLVVEVGRKAGDGLPDTATGAALMCYASGVDEAEAVRETVAILKQADMAPLDVSGYGTRADREAEGDEIGEDEARVDGPGAGRKRGDRGAGDALLRLIRPALRPARAALSLGA